MAAYKSEPGGDISETNIQTFKSVTELSEYSKRTRRVFRNSLASSNNRSVVLRPQNIYVVVLVYLRVVSPHSRKLRFVVNSQYHQVVTSRLLLALNCTPFTLHAI
jgi:hypothetical protein